MLRSPRHIRYHDIRCNIFRCATLPLIMLLMSCAEPYVQPSPAIHADPRLTESYAIMEDGYRLPLSRWETAADSRAVLLALHGLNDYSSAFDNLGNYLNAHGITVIAYDQRGFGKSDGQGLWHGSERLTTDLVTVAELLRNEYTGQPLYLLGESMGGAVVLSSLASSPPDVDGVVLIAPAVWTRDNMPFYQRLALWVAAHTFPGKELTGKGLDLKPSDNIEMLRALGADELVIKATRVDVLYGVSNLMDDAMPEASDVPGNILLLYGEHDDIIPAPPICELYAKLSSSESARLTAVTYENGYHMLTRDLHASVVMDDLATWIKQNGNAAEPGSNMRSYCNKIIHG